MIRLESVYRSPNNAAQILWDLLEERPAYANISHKRMPSIEEHRLFIGGLPYLDWFLILSDDVPVGAVYLTRAAEVGIAIFHKHQGNGYATEAIRQMKERYPGKLYANVAPTNAPSHAFFSRLGRIVQEVYEI